MPNREVLKELIDQLPEDRLAGIETILWHHLNPPQPSPEIEAMQRRSHTYREQVLRRFQETGRPGTCGIGSMSGSGGFGEHEGMRFGRQGFQYWDNKALVHQSMHYFDGHEIEIMERLSISEDRELCCAIEMSSGGKTVRYSDEFPSAAA